MRRHTLIPLLVVFAVTLPARSASAEFLEWLERLSGPGPFKGFGIGAEFACYGTPAPPSKGTEGWYFDPDCRRMLRDRDKRRIGVGVEVAWLSGPNNLDYDVPLREGAENVRVFSLRTFADYSLRPELDLGAGLGFMRFTGAPADPVTRFSLQIVRVTWKPLARGQKGPHNWRKEWLQLRYIGTLLPGGFDAEDFGARPGTFHTGTEFLSTLAVIIRPF